VRNPDATGASQYRVDADGIETWRAGSGPARPDSRPSAVSRSRNLATRCGLDGTTGTARATATDGVPGGKHPGSITPLIMPGQASPPSSHYREPAFIYHTHAHDETQLSGGSTGRHRLALGRG
jgi:hypothetical protein